MEFKKRFKEFIEKQEGSKVKISSCVEKNNIEIYGKSNYGKLTNSLLLDDNLRLDIGNDKMDFVMGDDTEIIHVSDNWDYFEFSKELSEEVKLRVMIKFLGA